MGSLRMSAFDGEVFAGDFPKLTEALRALFDSIDQDKNGMLSLDEHEAMAQLMKGATLGDEERAAVVEQFAQMDEDQDGTVSWAEFFASSCGAGAEMHLDKATIEAGVEEEMASGLQDLVSMLERSRAEATM